MRDSLRRQLIKHEGRRAKPYHDSFGNETIGIGHNLANGISDRAIDVIFEDDVDVASRDLNTAFPWFAKLDAVRQDVLTDMCFNLGIFKLTQFTGTLGFVERGEYEKAAQAMLQSLWAKQVGTRARTLALMMKTGKSPFEK